MLNFIDPVLYATTLENPNIMGVSLTLTEPVDARLLSEAAEEVRERFPYFHVRPEIVEGDLVLVENKLPVVVRETWEPTLLVSKDTNYHVLAWKVEGKRLAVEILHIVTDGSGFLPYVKSVLFCYLRKATGIDFDTEGFRLPGDEIPESETGNPFDDEAIEAAEKPFYKKPAVKKFVNIKQPEGAWRVFYIKLPEDQVMKYCGELDASPNALVCVLLARAVDRIQPQGDKTILGGVAINQKAALGNRDNYRCFSNLVYVDFPPGRVDRDLSLLCTVTRTQMMMQAQPENVLFDLREMKHGLAMLDKIPSIPLKMMALSGPAGQKRTTFTVSYASSRTFGPLDPYIEELYVTAEPTSSMVVCEIACINHAFFLHFEQCFESEALVLAFLDELRRVGITPELLGEEPYRTSGVHYDDVDVTFTDQFKSFVGKLRHSMGA